MPYGNNPKTGKPGPAPKPPRDGDKIQARATVALAVKNGVLPRANSVPCVDCGHVWIPGATRHEYDHARGYGADHHLDVEAVCAGCHAQRDSKKAKQTHCLRGHEFNPENTYMKTNGTRACRACMRIRDAARGPRGAEHWRQINAKRRAK